MKGRIVRGVGGFYYVDCGTDIYECKARGVFRKYGITPLTGDICEIDITDDAKLSGNIIKIMPRTSELCRPAAANADRAVIVFALKEPELSTGLLDRFLVNMELQNMEVVIAFSKSDLTDVRTCEEVYRAAGYETICFSSRTKEGIDRLKALLDGRISVLSGPSGSGKSSLINTLTGRDIAETGELSKKLGRGRNTTRHTELIELWKDTYIMDTPGYSSIDLLLTDEADVEYGFREFKDFIGKCYFTGCSHISEPGCAVKDAVQKGNISEMRYISYKEVFSAVKERRKFQGRTTR